MLNLLSAVNNKVVLQALEISWKGMLAIFLVMGIIYLMIFVLNKTTTKINKDTFKKLFSKMAPKKENKEKE